MGENLFSKSGSVIEVRDGIWALHLDLPRHSIGHVNVYALKSDSGTLLVDAGWGTPDVVSGLGALLGRIGVRFDDVTGVLATHGHADHVGAAGAVTSASGAWTGLHAADHRLMQDNLAGRPEPVEADEWVRRTGVDEALLEVEASRGTSNAARTSSTDRVRHIADGQVIHHGPWSLRAIHTPGHTNGHLSYHLAAEALLFSGDHVMSGITSGPVSRPAAGADPMGDYLRSVERLRHLDVDVALPGHLGPVNDLPGRLEELFGYHDAKIRQVLDELASGPDKSTWEIARALRHSRPWEQIPDRAKLVACRQTYGYLRHLQRTGLVLASESSAPIRWARAA